MRNFNTNQTRHFYVAGAIDANVDSNLDIALKQTATGEMYFVYKNADGLVTRSDTFSVKKIKSLNKAEADSLATPLMMYELQADTSKLTFQASSPLIGKVLNLSVTLHGVFDYDMDNSMTAVASLVGDSTNTASASAFYKALAIAIAKALPKNDPSYPAVKVFVNATAVTEVTASTVASDIAGDATKIYLVQGPQKYVRGKLSGEPIPFSIATKLELSNVEVIDWLTEGSYTLKKSTVTNNTVIPANFVLADLEYFALGERGDVYRGFNYPNDYTPTYAISLDPSTKYNVLSIEYFWAGNAENVQKSPRLIQVAAPATVSNDIVTELYDQIDAAMHGVASS